jgi:uncharacterized protein
MAQARSIGISALVARLRRRGSRARARLFTTILAIALLAGGAVRATEELRYFRIGTAATTGTYFQIGGVIANAISKPPGSRDCDRGGSCGVPGLVAVAQATQGSVENVDAVASGRLESALAQSDVAFWAYSATGLFKGKPPLTKLRAIAALFPESVHVVVRADGAIRSLKDLKGKRVGLGEKESGTLVDARLLLDAAGLSEKDLKPDYSRLAVAAAALDRGDLDAFFLFGGYPVPAITELAATIPVRLLPISDDVADKLMKKFHFFARDTIPAGIYSGIDEATPTVGMRSLLVVSSDIPEDLVYDITKALWSAPTRRALDQGHPMGQRIKLATALDGVPLPLHLGAERFYRQIGAQIPEEASHVN